MNSAVEYHDPGGKIKLPLHAHVRGHAEFSECGQYRHVLTRVWDDQLPWIMFVGMNPSTADVNHDDPTVRKECAYAHMWGYGGLIKCNIMDYRVTNPKNLLSPHVKPCHENNLIHVAEWICHANLVVAAWGRLPVCLDIHAKNMLQLLKAVEKPLVCLGKNLDGSPKHPLYVKMHTQPITFGE